MSKKRIVFIPYKLHLQNLLVVLAKQVPVTVILPPEKSLTNESPMQGVRIVYQEFGANFIKKFFRSEIRTLKYVKGLSEIFNKIDFSTLVTFEFYHWYTLQCISYKKNNPDIKLFVVSETKLWPKNIVANALKRLLFFYFKLNIKHIDGMFVYTETAYNFIKKYIPEAKITLLPTPIDVKLFKPVSERRFFQDGELKLLMNARFSPYKRYDDLFDAVAILINDGKKIKVTCISRYEHDREKITSLVIKKGLQGNVNIIDSLPKTEMPELYRTHDILVLPSYNEAIGLVVPEAMACGTPTITSDTVGANVYVKNGETGLIFKTGDVSELTKSIRSFFDIKTLETYGRNAADYIHTKFTPETTAEIFKKEVLKY